VSVCKLRALVIRFPLPVLIPGSEATSFFDSIAERILSTLPFTATRFKLIPGVADPYTFGVGGLGGLSTRIDRVVRAGCITES
jgi:hypothetical protein